MFWLPLLASLISISAGGQAEATGASVKTEAKAASKSEVPLKLELVQEKLKQDEADVGLEKGSTLLFSYRAKVVNTSRTSQLFCERAVLDTLTWRLADQAGVDLANANRGNDIDYDYSSELSESK